MKTYNKLSNKRGFTLAELLIVVAIIAILTSLAFVFFNPNDISLIEMDRSAESIAVAAQNRLTEIRNSGDVKKLRTIGDSALDDASRIGKRTSGEGGERYIFNYAVSESGIISDNGDMRYILPFGAIDEELNQNFYALVFQADTCMIKEVFYSTKHFKSHDAAYLDELRSEEKRKSENVGYYHGEVDESEVAFANLPTPQLTISNYEELTLSVYLPEVKQLNGKQLGIIISLADKERKAYTQDNLTYADTAIYSTFQFAGDGAADWTSTVYQQIETGSTYEIVLDTVDTVGNSKMDVWLSERNSRAFCPTGKFEEWAKRSKAYKGYSGSPLEDGSDDGFLLGDDCTVNVTVYCLNDDYTINTTFMPRSSSVTFNGWFGSVDTVGGFVSAEISCGRHLQNLAYLTQAATESMSISDTDVSYRENVLQVAEANQTEEIDFSCEAWNGVSFTPVCLPAGFKYHGNKHAIKHLNVKAKSGSFKLGGLFGFASNAEISGVMLENPTVSANMYAGALVGECLGDTRIEHCQVYLTKEQEEYDDGYCVKSNTYAGGLVGYCNGGSFTNCSASVYVQEGTKVGGLIGYAEGETSISGCYAAGILGGGYVGGLIGGVSDGNSISMSGSYSAGHIQSATRRAAGLIGKIGEDASKTELNANLAPNVAGNYCVVIYGKGEGKDTDWTDENGNKITASIYGTFVGDIHSDKSETSNYYIPQKGIEYIDVEETGDSQTIYSGVRKYSAYELKTELAESDSEDFMLENDGNPYAVFPYDESSDTKSYPFPLIIEESEPEPMTIKASSVPDDETLRHYGDWLHRDIWGKFPVRFTFYSYETTELFTNGVSPKYKLLSQSSVHFDGYNGGEEVKTLNFKDPESLSKYNMTLPSGYTFFYAASVINNWAAVSELTITSDWADLEVEVYVYKLGTVPITFNYFTFNDRVTPIAKQVLQILKSTSINFKNGNLSGYGITLPQNDKFIGVLDNGSYEDTIQISNEEPTDTSLIQSAAVYVAPNGAKTITVQLQNSIGLLLGTTTITTEENGQYTFTKQIVQKLHSSFAGNNSFIVYIYELSTGNSIEIGNVNERDVTIDYFNIYTTVYSLADPDICLLIKWWGW